uniref:Uncharacterized protein n=1 Tax=viral metagenome TaxID=1070528 RepID=A0A6C0JWQ3_9ZZZZ
MGKYVELMVVFPYSILLAFTLALWIYSIIAICNLDSCSYGTKCHFVSFNDTCILSVDNQTIIVDGDMASGDALYECTRNATIPCYYAKSRDSTGQFVSNYYKTACNDHYYNWLYEIIITNSIVLAIILVYYILIIIKICISLYKNTPST